MKSVESIELIRRTRRKRRSRTGSFDFRNISPKKMLYHFSDLSKHGYKLYNTTKRKTQKRKINIFISTRKKNNFCYKNIE